MFTCSSGAIAFLLDSIRLTTGVIPQVHLSSRGICMARAHQGNQHRPARPPHRPRPFRDPLLRGRGSGASRAHRRRTAPVPALRHPAALLRDDRPAAGVSARPDPRAVARPARPAHPQRPRLGQDLDRDPRRTRSAYRPARTAARHARWLYRLRVPLAREMCALQPGRYRRRRRVPGRGSWSTRKKDPGEARASPTGRIPHHNPDAARGFDWFGQETLPEST